MIKKICALLLVFISMHVFGWGITGHRTVGEVAEMYLSNRAKRNIAKILDDESLAVASTWMDEIKSDPAYDSTESWHWVTIPPGMTYEQTEKNPDGDVIETIQRLIKSLKAGNLSKDQEAKSIKMLVHLVGDIHQPLHVGTGEDMGGNKVRLKWFWESSNLHRVWDSDMIDSQKFSYTELAEAVNHVTKEEIKAWQSDPIMVWAQESIALRDQVYNIPEDNNLKYEYRYANWSTVEHRLLQAGVRLAGILNEIYG